METYASDVVATTDSSVFKEIEKYSEISNTDRALAIDGLTQLLYRLDCANNPADYCLALRKRAQTFSLLLKFDDALNDLLAERIIAEKCCDIQQTKECDDLITQISTWHEYTENLMQNL